VRKSKFTNETLHTKGLSNSLKANATILGRPAETWIVD
jgi:hypothetical protein